MTEKESPINDHQGTTRKNWVLFAIIGVMTAGVIYLAIFQEIWYRIVVLTVLITGGVLIYRQLAEMLKLLRESPGQIEAPSAMSEERPKLSEPELLEKESELQQLDLDRTQMFEELLSRSAIEEHEKTAYREKLAEKATETTRIREELGHEPSRLQMVYEGTKKYFVKDNPMKEIAASLDASVIENGTLAELNDEIQRMIPRLSRESLESLEKSSYMDDSYKLTRSGYKELVQAADQLK
ncbi:hypothetical protein [Alkalicoccobacillus porphyridii]|uniref:Uncharacterized protein n=1 Tax=Alkalicoccobacillus porphyridii TaxID=2597270 RepID=A0A553ZZW9_9BACI|nr:hypothetical protein [Alkalicoccobacillus porphyridii]TSB46994.1 hypothetical protein FN960_08215 [Alkalicoccobacillus porphyridii]